MGEREGVQLVDQVTVGRPAGGGAQKANAVLAAIPCQAHQYATPVIGQVQLQDCLLYTSDAADE